MKVLATIHRAEQVSSKCWLEAARDRSPLTMTQAIILDAIDIAGADGLDPHQSDLVAVTGVDRSTMADVLRRLAASGLVTRARDRSDLRAVRIRLTEEGRRELSAARKVAEEATAKLHAVVSGLAHVSIEAA